MITVEIRKSCGEYSGFSCSGHAGYAEEGFDIICAAVSVLTVNTINSIEVLTKTVPIVEFDEKAGYIHCSFEDDITEQPALLLDAMLLGLSQIKKQYGTKYIDVKIKEV